MRNTKRREGKRFGMIAVIALAAVAVIAAALLLGPFSKTSRYERKYDGAQRLYLSGKYEEAALSAEDALKIKETEEAYLLLAECHLARNDTARAENVLRLAALKYDSKVINEQLEKLLSGTETTSVVPGTEVGTVRIAGEELRLDTRIVSLAERDLSDVTELSELTAPESITLTDNRISDLRPFENLITLTYLQLGNNRITDLGPLSGLVALRSLYLDGNPISDFSPLYSLRSLTTLSLREVEMTEKQLDELRAALPNCTIYCDEESVVEEITLGGVTFKSDVTELDLGGKGLTDISALAKCTRLTKLDLRDNEISNLDALSGLAALDWLCLWNNKVEDVAALLPLSALRYLDLDGNAVTNLAPLRSLENLEELWLSGNDPKNLNALTSLTQLKRLGLKSIGLTEEDIEVICQLSSLKELAIEKNDIAAEWLDSLERSLPECEITHDDPYFLFRVGETDYRSTETTAIVAPGANLRTLEGLEQFERLVTLTVNDNELFDLSPLSELKKLQNLTLGNLTGSGAGNRFTDLSPLSGLTGLKHLVLNNCGLTSVTALAPLTELTELYLSDNMLGDISALSRMTKLNTLSLNYTGISDISALTALTSLTCLELEGNQISDLTPLYGLHGLRTLYLSHNAVTPEQVRALQEALPDCSIGTDLDLTIPDPDFFTPEETETP